VSPTLAVSPFFITMIHYVYRLDDPITQEFYIGSRSCSCKIDDDIYMGSYLSWKPQDRLRLVKTIIKSNFCKRETCIKFEAKLIKENIDNPLNRNYHIPGIGFHRNGIPHSAETKQKMSDNHADFSGAKSPMFGKTHSEDTRKKMRIAKLGENHIYYGKTRSIHSQWMIENHPRKRNVLQYDKNGNFINEWSCAIDAYNKMGIRNISSCCLGKRKTAGGYIWKFKNN
jgi:group I intron endonuclease